MDCAENMAWVSYAKWWSLKLKLQLLVRHHMRGFSAFSVHLFTEGICEKCRLNFTHIHISTLANPTWIPVWIRPVNSPVWFQGNTHLFVNSWNKGLQANPSPANKMHLYIYTLEVSSFVCKDDFLSPVQDLDLRRKDFYGKKSWSAPVHWLLPAVTTKY